MRERYWLTTPNGRIPLPGTLTPSALSLTAVSHNLVRGRGYRDVTDLSDGLPDPVPLTLTGEVRFKTEAELSLSLRELQQALRAATAIDRDGRGEVALASSSLLAVPAGSHSGRAALTVTLILASVPDPDSTDSFFW
ncbi:hypothetical protein DEIPH_ctg011orf0004 [Deinococcus phoenicis]|uniref:Uncharacterized protein n=1 Tax=Deinococcus phoenicis TaxID=1476583 RepID=A0A016QSU9_9DEIO|nr:hypothetical protein [Deinococcus phoenicis]EYB69041.1 hypothetical protein DEIPH_ctg011orf0004 [Deinococcus phoenicis]